MRFPMARRASRELSQQRKVTTATTRDIQLLKALRALGTASLCDADKSLQSPEFTLTSPPSYAGLQLLNDTIRPINNDNNNCTPPRPAMAGWARTVQCTRRNDLLAVLPWTFGSPTRRSTRGQHVWSRPGRGRRVVCHRSPATQTYKASSSTVPSGTLRSCKHWRIFACTRQQFVRTQVRCSLRERCRCR